MKRIRTQRPRPGGNTPSVRSLRPTHKTEVLCAKALGRSTHPHQEVTSN
jgi:hypothetical protein